MPYKDRKQQLAAQKRNYEDNKERQLENQRKSRQKTKDYINEIRKASTCKCGEGHIAVLDFHHRNPADKEVTISKMIKDKWSPARIDKEVVKCDILCSNCHRKLHWNEIIGM